MKITSRLRLGFAVLILVLLVAGSLVLLNLRSMDRSISDIVEFRQPYTNAAYEIKVQASRMGRDVNNYLSTGDDSYLDLLAEDRGDLKSANSRFEGLARGAEDEDLSRKVDRVSGEYQDLARTLTDQADGQRGLSASLEDGLDDIQEIVEGPDFATDEDPGASEASEARLEELEANVQRYLRTQDPEDRDEVLTSVSGFRQSLQRLGEQDLDAEETRSLERVETLFDEVSGSADALIAQTILITDTTESFIQTQRRLDGILDNEVQSRSSGELQRANQRVHDEAGRARVILILTFLAGLAVSLSIASLIGRRVRHSLRRFKEGTGRIGRGEMDHRIPADEGDELDSVALAFNDMLDRRRSANDALRESEERFRSLSGATSEGVVISEGFGWILESNGALSRMFGYGTHEMIGLEARSLVVPESRRSIEERLSEESEEPCEVLCVRKDRSRFIGECRIWSGHYQGREVYISTIRDVTEQRRARRALIARDERLRAGVNNAQIVLYTLDQSGVVQMAAGQAWGKIGLEPEDVVGRRLEELGPDYQIAVERSTRALAGEELHFETEFAGHYFDSWYSPVRDETGAVSSLVVLSLDVTERRRAEEGLRASESRYQTLIEQVPAAIYTARTDKRTTYMSPRVREMLGYEPEEFYENGFWYGVVHPEDLQRVREADARSRKESEDFALEYRMVSREGRVVWVRDETTLLRDAAGEPESWQGILTDISRRRKTEQDLIESQRRFERIFESSADALFVHDAEGRIFACNTEAHESLGYTHEELLGVSVRDFSVDLESPGDDPSDSPDHSGSPWRRMVSGEKSSGVHFGEHRRRDGSSFPVEVRVSPVEYDGKRLMLAAVRDISARVEAGRAVQEAEERFAGAFYNSPVGMSLVGLDGTYLKVNRVMQEITGLSEEELLEKNYRDLTYPEDVEISLEQDRRLRSGEVESYSTEKRYLRADGSPVWISSSVSLARDEDGAPLYFISQSEDISQKKAADEELARARDEALESTRAKSEFLANMSHEIRTPMNGIIGMTELLLDTSLDTDQREYAETVRLSGESLLTIINDILDFSKMEAGKMRLEETEFDLLSLVEEVTTLFARHAQVRGLELASLVEFGLPTALEGDPGRLRQVLANLLSNAIKFTEAGAVSLRAEPLDSSNEQSERVKVRFEVSDSGIGIGLEERDRLFQSFSQADASTTRRYGGTGLGLAISRQLVRLMGGEMGVESELEVGSTFWFTVDLGRQKSGVSALLPRTELSGLKVLVVDDSEMNREILWRQISPWDMRVECVESGERALDRISREAMDGDPYGVAVIDAHMPQMDGLALAAAIKSDPRLSETRLVMLTSLGDEDGEAAWDSGVSAYLTKPVRQSELYDALATVMSGDYQTPTSETGRRVTRQTLRSARSHRRPPILVVEDNPVNQKVAARTLERLGYRPEIASNGLHALEALQRDAYAAVLMDIQMPEMDGYEATAEIRRRENEDPEGPGHRTPIIAMTANAMRGDRERSLAAGMDDYLAKPVKPEDLSEKLAKLVPRTGPWTLARTSRKPSNSVKSGGESAGTPKDGSPEEVLSQSVLSGLRELQNEDDPGLMRELLATFREDTSRRLETLEAALEAGDSWSIERTAHAVKGSSGNMGALRVSRLAAELQEAGSGGNFPKAEHLLEDLRREYLKARSALEASIGEESEDERSEPKSARKERLT